MFCTRHLSVLESDSKTHLRSRLWRHFKKVERYLQCVSGLLAMDAADVVDGLVKVAGELQDVAKRKRGRDPGPA